MNKDALNEISKLNDCRELLIQEGERLTEIGDVEGALTLASASKILGSKVQMIIDKGTSKIGTIRRNLLWR